MLSVTASLAVLMQFGITVHFSLYRLRKGLPSIYTGLVATI